MRWKAAGFLMAVVVASPVVSRAQTVTIRTYNNYGVSNDSLAVARQHVQTAFTGAGVTVSWVDCWYRDEEVVESSDRCGQPLKPNEVILRLQAANPLPGRRYVSMGFALVNLPEGVPFLATVYVDLVRSVSRNARLDEPLLLGRAIAHEIGHLLLDTNRHAEEGLMRAGWSHAELRANAQKDWMFGADEIPVIRTAAAMRNQ